MRELEAKGKVYQIIIGFLWALQTSISPFLLNLDYVKDLVLYLILRETVLRIEKTCEQLRFDCLAASGTEQDLLLALLIIFCVSIFSTSAMSFFERKQFFKANQWLDIAFCFVSPLLPGIYHFKVNRLRYQLVMKKETLCNDEIARREEEIEKLYNSIQQTKAVEIGLESVMQILLLLGLASFGPYVFKAPSGQTYSYFYGVALLVLKGNYVLFSASIS